MNDKKIKSQKKQKKILSEIKKAFFLFIFGFIFIEGFLWILEINGYLVEPYEWGNRNDIAYKINNCYELFSAPENEDKIKIIIIGDSGPETAFNPELLDRLFNKKTISYNLAFYGTAIRVQSLIINKIIIPKIKPDIVIWDLSVPYDFEDRKIFNNQENSTLSNPAPSYYSGNKENLDFEGLCDYYLFKYSRLYRYRKTLRPNLFNLNQDLVDMYELYGSLYERGWMRSSESIGSEDNKNITEFTYITEGYENPEEKIYLFDLHEKSRDLYFDTVKALEKNTDYFLIIAKPHYKEKIICPLIYSYFNELSPSNFLDLNGNEELNFPYYWWNEGHLNEYGSQIYTRLIYEKISLNIDI